MKRMVVREKVFVQELCAEQFEIGNSLPVYVHHNPNFKLPEDHETPIIMIGAGTGVAPFRALLRARRDRC